MTFPASARSASQAPALPSGGSPRGTVEALRGSLKPRILYATPEMADFVKTGGLGEVAASLPRALRQHYDVRILIPGYRQVVDRHPDMIVVAHLAGNAEMPPCDLGLIETGDGLPVYVILNSGLYERDGSPYGDQGADFPDNDLRFARLSLAAVDLAQGIDPDWRADLLHLNDWQTALAPAYLAWRGLRTPTVLTIHNLAYQGLFPWENLGRLGVPESAFHIDGVEFYGKLSFLKAACSTPPTSPPSARPTPTRSPRRNSAAASTGCCAPGPIRDGSPASSTASTNRGIPAPIPSSPPGSSPTTGRASAPMPMRCGPVSASACRAGPSSPSSRASSTRRGVDLTLAAAESIVAEGGQLVVTGQGEPRFEAAFLDLARRHPGSVGVRVGFEETDAHRMFAGSDFLLMPSRFEPCGLAQMYAQRFGSLPIAHRTGGLADTVEDGVTGFLFGESSLKGLSGPSAAPSMPSRRSAASARCAAARCPASSGGTRPPTGIPRSTPASSATARI